MRLGVYEARNLSEGEKHVERQGSRKAMVTEPLLCSLPS